VGLSHAGSIPTGANVFGPSPPGSVSLNDKDLERNENARGPPGKVRILFEILCKRVFELGKLGALHKVFFFLPPRPTSKTFFFPPPRDFFFPPRLGEKQERKESARDD